MVCRLDPRDCACGICDGGHVAPEGYFGGTWCPCECHALKGDERDKFIAKRRTEQQAAADKLVENAFKNETLDKDYLVQCGDGLWRGRYVSPDGEMAAVTPAPTPRTDAFLKKGDATRVVRCSYSDLERLVLEVADFARQLERELAEMRLTVASKTAIIEKLLHEDLSARRELEEKPVAWLIERPKGTGQQQTIEYELVLSPLTDDTFMDEGDEAWPLYKQSYVKEKSGD